MTAFLQSLDDLFDQYLHLIGQMQDILKKETEHLRLRDVSSLEQTTRTKEVLAERINALTTAQQDLFRTHNLSVGRNGVDRFFATLPDDPRIAPLRAKWSEVRSRAEQCNDLNASNGAYIALLRQHVQRSLDVLHGQTHNESIYGPDGARHRPTASRKLLSV